MGPVADAMINPLNAVGDELADPSDTFWMLL